MSSVIDLSRYSDALNGMSIRHSVKVDHDELSACLMRLIDDLDLRFCNSNAVYKVCDVDIKSVDAHIANMQFTPDLVLGIGDIHKFDVMTNVEMRISLRERSSLQVISDADLVVDVANAQCHQKLYIQSMPGTSVLRLVNDAPRIDNGSWIVTAALTDPRCNVSAQLPSDVIESIFKQSINVISEAI